MKNDTILSFARSSGIDVAWLGKDHQKFLRACKKFAKLVIKEEREGCIYEALEEKHCWRTPSPHHAIDQVIYRIQSRSLGDQK